MSLKFNFEIEPFAVQAGDQVVDLQIWKGDASAEHALSLLLDGIEVETVLVGAASGGIDELSTEGKERALQSNGERNWLMCTGDAGDAACRSFILRLSPISFVHSFFASLSLSMVCVYVQMLWRGGGLREQGRWMRAKWSSGAYWYRP
jgi:hypothetical protein